MIIHYLKIAFRNIIKDKKHSFINLLGLSVAIACCFLLIFWIRFELSFEHCYPNADRIYKVVQVEKREGGLFRSDYFRPSIYQQLKEKFPEIGAATYISHEKLPLVYGENEGIMTDYVVTTPDFLAIFPYEYIEGTPDAVIKSKTCIITEEVARKFFGNETAVGKTLTFGKDFMLMQIGAVVRLPKNTQIRFGLLNPFGFGFGGIHYMLIKENARFDNNRQKQLSGFLSSIQETENTLEFQPLKEVHLHSAKELAVNSDWETYGDWQQILLFSLATLLVLVIAIVNYVNTSVAKAMTRMKEVGIRKVAGSSKGELVVRFLLESFILSFLSVVLALLFTKWYFPAFSEIMGNQTSYAYDATTGLIAVVVCLIISLLSGGYAAFYLSSFGPVKVLRGVSPTGSKEGFRKILIGFQFFLSIAILACTVIIYKQLNEIFNVNTGVERNNIIVIESNLFYGSEDFFQEIKRGNPNVLSATMASCAPYNALYGYGGISWEGSGDIRKDVGITHIDCDSHYADVFGLTIIEGEFIPPGLTWWQDSKSESFNIVINESFKKMMGMDNPIGTTVHYGNGDPQLEGKIIGIVKDFNFKPLKEEISPLIISFNPEASSRLFIKTTGKDQQATLNYILAKYKEMCPQYKTNRQPIVYSNVEEDFQKMYWVELRMANILFVFSIISLLLSVLGIVSMVSFMVEKRAKEIAIRKINGAETIDIIKLLSRDFIKLGIIASIAAIPPCYVIMNQWLQSYIYHTSLSWWIFILVPAFILFITWAVISVQVYLTVRDNPVESLRNE